MRKERKKEQKISKVEYIKEKLSSPEYTLKEFIQYISSLKEGGGDVTKWSFTEIEALILQYKQKKHEARIFAGIPEENREWSRPLVFYPWKAAKEIATQVPKKLKIYETSSRALVKDIIKRDIGRIFTNVHTYYVIETQPQGWRVERRYKDVLKLRKCLSNSFPGFIIPSLPEILFEGEREDQACSEYIDLFFQHLLKIPEFRGFELVENFLAYSDRKDLLSYLNTVCKTGKQEDIEKMIHSTGKAKTEVNAKLIIFSKNAGVFAKQNRECLDELYTLNRDVSQQFEKMTNRLREASFLFRKLSGNCLTIQTKRLEYVYKTIELMLIEWSSLIEKQWRNFRDAFSNYLKYYIFESESIIELTKNTKKAEEEYLAIENELAIKKHILFQIKDFDKWQISAEDRKNFAAMPLAHDKKLAFPKMLPQETKVVEEKFSQYGYYLNRTREEVTRVIEKRVVTMYNHFNTIANDYASSAEQMGKMWLDFRERDEIPEGNDNDEEAILKNSLHEEKKIIDLHLYL